jgi:hypothetical protein
VLTTRICTDHAEAEGDLSAAEARTFLDRIDELSDSAVAALLERLQGEEA